jgi:hypothetical protein
MAEKRRTKPKEINMTDLEADKPAAADGDVDVHAAGTPAGGTAAGGLAGTNIGDGSPDNADLEDALGSGIHDTAGEEEDEPGYAGPRGGAVGGTPAQGRASGGRVRRGIAPGTHRGDSTVGSDPDQES